MKCLNSLFILIFIAMASASVAGGPMQFDKLVFTSIDAADGLSDNQVLHLLQLHDGRMAVTTSGNVNIYNGAGFDYVHYNDSSMYRIDDYRGSYHVYAGRDNKVWIKDWGVMQCFDMNTLGYVNDLDSLFNDMSAGIGRVTDLFIDQESNLWLVNADGLIDVERQSLIKSRFEGEHLEDLEIKGDTVMLFYSSGMVKGFDRNTSQPLFTSRAYDDERAGLFGNSSLVKLSPDGNIYQIRTGRGGAILLRFNPADLSWREIMQVPYILHTLAIGADGDIYITSRGGLWHVDGRSLEARLIPTLNTTDGEIKADNFNTIFIDRDEGVWIGTYHSGLLYAHPLRFRMHYSSPEPMGISVDTLKARKSPTAYRINDILVDSRGREWSATRDGLKVKFNDSDSTFIYTDNGLVNNNVKALVEARDGSVWASTSYGISSITPDETGHGYTVRSFTPTDGTLHGEYMAGQAFSLNDGSLLFQGQGGWTRFHPDSVESVPISFRPVFTSFTANDTRINIMPDSVLTLPYHSNKIAIEVASLNYHQPLLTVFKMSINGSDWTIYQASDNGTVDRNGLMHLKFMNQPPGRYNIKVAAATTLQALADAPVSTLEFIITPPWWLTKQAVACYAIAIVAAMIAAFLIYNRITRNRLKRKHREEMLLMRIHNLIERCDTYERQQAEKSASSPAPTESCGNTTKCNDEEEAALSPQDREFIAKAMSLVEANIGVRGFSVEQLSKELCMERTGLYKKMTFLLDKSPSAFIRSIRLNHAAALVRDGELTMTEIAERTGFSSASHMSRCFIDEFGCKPSEYARRSTSEPQ